MALTYAEEAPLRPREVLVEKQKLFQSIQKNIHLKGRYDKLTSVIIPLGGMIARGIYNIMSHGIKLLQRSKVLHLRKAEE
ncbi:hypothetical protein MKX01_026730 [Papaver californicum]|nr:hypothetical protein MKX01_026730 [Papaver californicum]